MTLDRKTKIDNIDVLILLAYYEGQPTIRELQTKLNFKSHNTVFQRIGVLVRLGFMENKKVRASRSYRLSEKGIKLLKDLENQRQVKLPIRRI